MKNNMPYKRKLRACLNCSILKLSSEFRANGCDNCTFIPMKNNMSNVIECTSDSFKGLMAIMDTKTSWVAKWQRVSEYKNGTYAITVSGELPEHFVDIVEQSGKSYVPRDKPFTI